jgi:hypothetical protein
MEEIIWRTIADSAKKRFDYASFEKEFFEIDKNIADNILFNILGGLASGETHNIISEKLFNKILLTGFKWNKKDIIEFLKDKKDLLKIEINATRLAGEMLNSGTNQNSILVAINQILSN